MPDSIEGQQHGLQLCYLKQNVLGFVVYTDERLRPDFHRKVLTVIGEDLQEMIRILPQTVIQRMMSCPIQFWVNLDNGAGKKGCCCHCIDLPAEYMACKSHSVEIFNVEDFLEQTVVQPAQLLHEVSHWLHHDIIKEEHKFHKGVWRSSSGLVRASDPNTDFRRADNTVVYRMSGFCQKHLNGKFVLESAGHKGSNLILVQGSIVCRCTDRWSNKNPKCPDRWHLEMDGHVLAYRLGTGFGWTVTGWNEWVDGRWLPTNGVAEALPSDAKTVLVLEGFSQGMLNGDYLAKTSLDWYRCARAGSGTTSRIWVNASTDTVLRYTNMFSQVSDAQAPFDRWHLEAKGFGCSAYLCDANPTAVHWKEAVASPTDQMIFNAYISSLPLYTRGCQRVGHNSSEAHYAATNHKEFFAECSEAYFSTSRFRNDYFPYIHEELKAYDPAGYAMCERIWGPRSEEEEFEARYFKEFGPKCDVPPVTPHAKRHFLDLVGKAAQARRRDILQTRKVQRKQLSYGST